MEGNHHDLFGVLFPHLSLETENHEYLSQESLSTGKGVNPVLPENAAKC
jgi:hypothetical protein